MSLLAPHTINGSRCLVVMGRFLFLFRIERRHCKSTCQCCSEKVLHDEISADSRPRRNHSARSAEDPCVKDSGLTYPLDIFCSRSSPTAATASMPAEISEVSMTWRCC